MKDNSITGIVSAKKRGALNEFRPSTNVLTDGVTAAPSVINENRQFLQPAFGRPGSCRVSRVVAKKSSEVKNKELRGSNPIAHTHTSPFVMPADGRVKSLAGCFGSSGMKDALDIKVHNNWELK